MRRYRRRRRAGIVVLPVEVPETDLAAELVAAGLIREDEQDSRAALARGLGVLVARLLGRTDDA